MNKYQWKTTVDNLLRNFRGGLLSMLPYLKETKITHGVNFGYDGWEEISSVLYKNLVVEVIRYSLPLNKRECFALPDYEMEYNNYSRYMYLIECCLGDFKEENYCIFQNFNIKNSEFDIVDCCIIDKTLRVVNRVSLPYEQTVFRFLSLGDKSEPRIIQNIIVES